MMPMRRKGASPANAKAAFVPLNESPIASVDEWEVRPGGMLVQKRDPDSVPAPAPTIRVRVKYGAVYHEIYLSSQTTFGELKKLLSPRTGLHPEDQKLIYKGKVRSSKAYLDLSGVKDGSKMVVVEDAAAQAKRFLETRRQAKIDKSSKSISQIGLDVDKLASEVSALETVISKGGRVPEKDVVNLIELFMTQLVKLDGVVADGDLKLQKRMQERRMQRYVETLDVLKIKNAMPRAANEQMLERQPQKQQPPAKKRAPPSVVVTTKWEAFDSLFSPTAASTATSTATTASGSSTVSSSASAPAPKLDWELF
ncbi:BAG family molecular chaperone regulator 2 [Elaeis guineensis]|uniref:BAG family molecular chaperone regulator 2 n=1 Tax=Elaeis guineensis var. tenera TaxID=51953 RepID=A0A6I9R8B0_ELAGV|nr:BAG family molecular chaperone regulator 2 [Elaeis guineensis]